MSWRENIEELPREQRSLVQGGGLSQRFIQMPLDLSHPAFIGAFYGLLVCLALLLPMGWSASWDVEVWWITFILTTLFVMMSTSILGLLSRIACGMSGRLPVAPPRKYLYPMPFVGLAWLTLVWTGLVDFWIWGAWLMLLLPGPVYIHLSWAPRWRLLVMIESGVDPFSGMKTKEEDASGGDEELADVVATFEEE